MLMSGRTYSSTSELEFQPLFSELCFLSCLRKQKLSRNLSLINVSLIYVSISRDNTWSPLHLKIQCSFYWSPYELCFWGWNEFVLILTSPAQEKKKKVKLLKKEFQPQQGILSHVQELSLDHVDPRCSFHCQRTTTIMAKQGRDEKFQLIVEIFP